MLLHVIVVFEAVARTKDTNKKRRNINTGRRWIMDPTINGGDEPGFIKQEDAAVDHWPFAAKAEYNL
jgi:hypothetical protein